jgi:hypothetical protein
LPVPAQDRGWCDQESAAAASGWQSSEGGDYGSVGPADPRSWCASLQDGQLMAQDEDLNLIGGFRAGVEHHPARQLREHLAISFTATGGS